MLSFPVTVILDNGIEAEVNKLAGYPGRYIFNLTLPNKDKLFSFAYSTGASLSDNGLHQDGQLGPDAQNAIAAFLKLL